MEEVRRLFKPEFLNRIDEIIVFHQISRENLKDILDIMMREVQERAEKEMDIRVSVTDEAKEFLIEKGYAPKYGARPLRRTIQTYVEDQLAEQILDGRIRRHSTVRIGLEADGKELKFSVRKRR